MSGGAGETAASSRFVMARTTTVGQILVNDTLPETMRDERRVLDKSGLKALLRELMEKHPDRYKEVVHRLGLVGAQAAYTSGTSFSLDDLKSSEAKKRIVKEVNQQIREISADPRLTDERRDDEIVRVLASRMDELRDETHREGLESGNSFSGTIRSGSRGNIANLSSLRGADLLVLDHKDRPIPIPITHNFSEGLDPAEYFAGAYGTRKGVVSTKMATAEAGFLGKQLANSAGRLIITDEDPIEGTGLPVETDDEDNEGAVLARDYGRSKSGTVLTPSMLRALKRQGHDHILVHSPISAGGSGVPRLSAGFRERGGFSPVGDHVGVAAAQAISEPISQSQLSAKHAAGVVGAAHETSVSGFQAINQLVQIPKSFQNAAALSRIDGRVSRVESAPQGGNFVWVGAEQHYVPDGVETRVKVGDEVEAGDVLSAGVPNPSEIVKYKHVGEGRRYLVEQLRRTLRDNGIGVHRRNLELLSRGLVNHVRVLEPDGIEGALPDDIIPYDDMARNYQPRHGNLLLSPAQTRGKYLERPTLHYSIGTRITPSVIRNLKKYKVPKITVHNDPPPFEPHMVRAMESSLADPDFFRRLQGFYIGKGFMDAAQRGGKSEIHGQNWGHSLAQGVGFGRQLKTQGVF